MAGHGGRRPGAGRPKGVVSQAKRNLAEAAREHTDAALQALRDVMDDEASQPSARIAAAVAILDRGHGKPRQAVEVTGNEGVPIPTLDMSRLSTATLTEIVEQMAENSPRKRIEQRLAARGTGQTGT